MSKDIPTPIKSDELAAICAAASVCCADTVSAFVAKKKAGRHPSFSAAQGKKVMECYRTVRKDLMSGECAELYKEHLACVQYYGWRDSVVDCKTSYDKVRECALANGYGEMKDQS